MLAVPAEKPFDNPEWLFEIKWDGYRAVAFLDNAKTRLVSRNQNDLTAQFSELGVLPQLLKAKSAVLDGEIVALDGNGRSSFSLMQQRTGMRSGGRRLAGNSNIAIAYYVFDLLYLDGYDLRRVELEDRKQILQQIISPNGLVRYSDHFPEHGIDLFRVAQQKGLEGILAKRRASLYEERRSHDWQKIKITQTADCVVGGYTDPEGSRQYFGSLILGLYDSQSLVHVGQAGTGFDARMLKEIYRTLKGREAAHNPFTGNVDARSVHWVKPELVAEIKFSEWTHETSEGGLKLRAPVFLRLRTDKQPKDCTFQAQGLK
jgi:bifunctional non-homologous end joining protein LigD